MSLEKKKFFEFSENGKKQVRKAFEADELMGQKGKILKNITIPSKGQKVEIELVFITEKGIFLIENKRRMGYIFGNEKNELWDENLYFGKDRFGKSKIEKHQFYNPIWESNIHIKNLKKYLDEEVPFFCVLAFSDKCQFKKVEVENKNVAVCYKREKPEAIKKLWDSFPSVLSNEEISDIYEILYPLSDPEKVVVEKEEKPVFKKEKPSDFKKKGNFGGKRKKTFPPRKKESIGLCPKCGGKLVLKTVKSGPDAGKKFYGCFNYPKCRYMKNLDK